jgi:hypothetical protein
MNKRQSNVALLKTATLRRLDKITFRLWQAAVESSKTDPEAQLLGDELFELHKGFYNEIRRRDEARAEKLDAGVVLFTTYVPETKNNLYVKEIIQTPNRRITTLMWRRGWGDQHWYDRSTGQSIELLGKYQDPFHLLKFPPLEGRPECQTVQDTQGNFYPPHKPNNHQLQ